MSKMSLCDKCARFNKCFPGKAMPEEFVKWSAQSATPCPKYKELTVKSMFMPKRKERK